MKDKMESILKNYKVQCILKYLGLALLVFLGFRMVLNLCYVSESLYQTIRSYYLYVSVCYLMLIILILRKIRFHWSQMILIVVLGLVGFFTLKNFLFAPDLFRLYTMQYIGAGMGCVFLLDLILFHRDFYKNLELKTSIVWLIMFGLLVGLTKGRYSSFVFLFPAAIAYITLGEKQVYRKFLAGLSGGYYIAFLFTMLKSFVMVPYTGERYYGIFLNHGLFGIFIGGAFICALCWLMGYLKKEKKNIWILIALSIALLFTVICLMMNSARVSQVACILALVFAIVSVLYNNNPKKLLKYLMIVAIIGILGIAAVIGVLAIFHNIPEKSIEQALQGNILQESVLYWKDRADTAFNTESRLGVIPDGTLLNAIDRFSSARISYCLIYLQRLSLFGNPVMGVQTAEDFFMHPHNIYVFSLYGFGIIGGTAMIILFVVGIIKMIRHYFKENKEIFFPMMWVIYYAFVGMAESSQWNFQVGFIAILMFFPLFIKKNTDSQKEKKADVKQ